MSGRWKLRCLLAVLCAALSSGARAEEEGTAEVSWDEIEAWADGVRFTRTETHSPPPAEAPKPADAPPASPPPPAPSETRKPVPPPAAIAAAEKLVRQNLKIESARPTPSELAAAAQKLVGQSRSTEDPAQRYVMLRDASTLAATAGDIALALAALDELGAVFNADALSLKMDALSRASAAATAPGAHQPLAAAACILMEAAAAAENFDAALRLASFAEDAARRARDPRLAATLQSRAAELREIQAEFAKVKSARQTLQAKPGDAEASLVLGKYLCVYKHDWPGALPLLAKGPDAALKALVEKDLAAPADSAAQLALADGYWDWSTAQNAAVRACFRLRAVEGYAKCLAMLSGPARERAEERLKNVPGGAAVEPGNVALASNGAAVTAPTSPTALIDGVTTGYTGGSGFAWGSSSPCELLVTLPKLYFLREIRFLLWDLDGRWYNYALEVSFDGKTFATVADRSKGKWRSWQFIPLAQPVKVIKLKGLFSSTNNGVHVVELEAYCQPPPTRPAPKQPSEEK